MVKIKDKENIRGKEKQQVTYMGIPIRLLADFSAETRRPEESGMIKVIKGINLQPRMDLMAKLYRRFNGYPKFYRQAKA